MQKLSWKECNELAYSIYRSRPGEWSHKLNGEKVRFEKRVKAPNGQIRVFYRGRDSAGSVSELIWERDARPLIFKQLTLF